MVFTSRGRARLVQHIFLFKRDFHARWMFICLCVCVYLNILFIYFSRERGREGDREEEKHQCVREKQLPLTRPQPGTWPATQACALTGNRTGNLLVHRLALNPLSHMSQGSKIFLYVSDTCKANSVVRQDPFAPVCSLNRQ